MFKRIKNLMLGLVIIGVASISSNIVNAEEAAGPGKGEFECIFDKEVYYEGEPINMTWQLAEDYATEAKITDFEMELRGYLMEEESILELKPVLEGANYSSVNERLYYIQIQAMAEKIRLNGGEKIATATYTIPETLFPADDTQIGTDIQFQLLGNEYWSDDSESLVLECVYADVVPYEVGDITRDHEVDFFDVTELIAAVYDSNNYGELDWRQKNCITSNTADWIIDENPDYDWRTADLGFFDIIYLIKTIYD